MAASRAVLMTVEQFRKTENFSGEVRVRPGSRTRRGVRRHERGASCNSLDGLAGPVATNGAAAGGSAHSSAAHAASRAKDADPADSQTKRAERTLAKGAKESGKRPVGAVRGGGGPIEALWEERAMLDGGDPLPPQGPEFVDCVNDYIDLVRTTELLLRDPDAKSSKSLLERLFEMKYGEEARASAGQGRSLAGCTGQTQN